MTQEQYNQLHAVCVKSACAGFAQSLINKGFNEQQVQRATIAYAHPSEGLLTKRASNIEALRQGILQKVAALRAAYLR